jgi:hypothetical protein
MTKVFLGVAVEVERRRVTRGAAAAVTFTPSEFVIFDLLWRRRPGVVRFGAVDAALYGARPDGGPDGDPRRVFVCRIRRALLPLGLGVEVVRGAGWRLTDLGAAAVQPVAAPGAFGLGVIDGAVIAEIRRLDAEALSQRAIADRLALPAATVAEVISGRRPHRGSHLGQAWTRRPAVGERRGGGAAA